MNSGFRTIVGGRSSEHHDRNNFPRGIEILLKKAKVDTQFKKVLLRSPLEAAKSIELNLKENEKKILENTPKPLLETMIENTFVPKHHVRTFLTAKTAAMLALVLASTVVVPSYANATKGERAVMEEKVSLYQLTEERMAAIQNALEQYKQDNGAYRSTDKWLSTSNPLDGYIITSYLYDPLNQKFHYEAVLEEDKIVSYKLESLGAGSESNDNISCPIDTEEHRF
jgi:type II secretory pathway pseudopilin PulG